MSAKKKRDAEASLFLLLQCEEGKSRHRIAVSSLQFADRVTGAGGCKERESSINRDLGRRTGRRRGRLRHRLDVILARTRFSRIGRLCPIRKVRRRLHQTRSPALKPLLLRGSSGLFPSSLGHLCRHRPNEKKRKEQEPPSHRDQSGRSERTTGRHLQPQTRGIRNVRQ